MEHLRIKVNTNSNKSEIGQILSDGTIKVNVKSVPEKGKANLEVIKILAKHYQVSTDQIKIISGQTSSIKLIKIL
jgi:hypothetical protein